MVKKETAIVNEKYQRILEVFSLYWIEFSSFLVNLNEKFKQINDLVNRIYSNVQKDDDLDSTPDHAFSVLRLGMIIWSNKVYKRCFKSLV